MKPFRLIRFLLLFVSVFVLVINSTNAETRSLKIAGLSMHQMSANPMMNGEEHCTGCLSGVMPITQDSHCVQCVPWIQAQTFVALLLFFTHMPYQSFAQIPIWVDHQSLPWKPPRNTVLNG